LILCANCPQPVLLKSMGDANSSPTSVITTGLGGIVIARVIDSSTKHSDVRPTRQNWRWHFNLIIINFKTSVSFRKFFTSLSCSPRGKGLESTCTVLIDFSWGFAVTKKNLNQTCFDTKIAHVLLLSYCFCFSIIL